MARRVGRFVLVAAAFAFAPLVPASDAVECAPPSSEAVSMSKQDQRLRMCALVGIWDTIVTGHNRHGYSGAVIAWVDDSVTAVRAAVRNLDLLQCADLDPPALARTTLELVTQLSDPTFDPHAHKPFDPVSNRKASLDQTPCHPTEAEKPEALVSFAPGEQGGHFQSSFCSFEDLKLPKDAVVLAAGAYGGRRIGFQIDPSGHEGTQIDVAVNQAKPVVLLLGAYEPTIWNIGWSPGTRIVAVLASGYHRQMVAGLKGDVPIIVSTYDNQGPCGYFYDNRRGALSIVSRRLLKRDVNTFYPAQAGRVLVGSPIPAGTRLSTASVVRRESFRDTTAPMAGRAGLVEALKQGRLRRATESDFAARAHASRGCPPQQGLLRISSPGVPGGTRAYVVLDAFTYPAGLTGAHAVTFFIPKGVPRPSGNPGHSVIYDFNTADCQGRPVTVTRGMNVSPAPGR